ncbi:MBL fold metallo-hydrolase [Janthinobacterium sp. PC23-8]|uniref:MBL fold metallo-hydrolase n=1 Tax=Janthinobacterium sp. PC23-8 TaxID=2012679 RepID=UPI000B972071|nr:MBL fold metallo-hydrolase [Janthinobacterium sp. PC23-8]OYO31726.1 hydrolase [Janthinobacterium sp. PC23-8]
MSISSCTLRAQPAETTAPAATTVLQRVDGKFRNPVAMHKLGGFETMKLIWAVAVSKPAGTVPTKAVPVQALSQAQLLAAPDNTLFRLGHSTLLLKLNGHFFLTDPVFSERASPVQWAGPKRFHQPPISIEELPPIKAVILSHDHYDHLDHAAVLALAAKTEHFVTPLGVGDTLVEWGIPKAKVQQFDWWQGVTLEGVRLVAAPSQHFSGRGLFDGNKTLWASWVIEAPDLRVFFSGDTGYFDGFKQIGEQYGPFDVTMIETGAYDKLWPDVHMQPEQTLQAHLDLKGKWLIPVHNGTFDLGLHAWHEPFDRIAALAARRGVKLSTPQMGEAVNLRDPQPGQKWWLTVVEQEMAE